MPATRTSMLDEQGPALLPGEAKLSTKRDPFYGEVEIGPGPTTPGGTLPKQESSRARANRLQREVDAGVHVLDGEEQNHVEVLTGKRLQQRAPGKREDLPPTDLETPTATSLEPSTAVLGSPDFDIHVKGTGFVEGSTIVFAGNDEPTTLNSDTDVSTGVNMAVWLGPDPAIPVLVRNPDDQETEPLLFSFTAAGTRTGAKAAPAPKHEAAPKHDDKGR